jgi:hypothetical protein
VYLKRVDSAIYDGAAGDGWFKLWDMGYTDGWCSVKMADSGGFLTVNLPRGIVGGYYLVRPEILALHNANNGNPQYYVSCAQVYIQSSGDLVPQSTVSIPGHCKPDDAADSWNVYYGSPPPQNYIPPGPAPAALVNGGLTNNNAAMGDGGKPEGCILDVAGTWCGFEVPSYSDQEGCWAVSNHRLSSSCHADALGSPKTIAGLKAKTAGRASTKP